MATTSLSGPLTFVQYMQRINQPKVSTYWKSFIQQRSIPTYLGMVTEEALIKRGRRVIDKLPAVTALQMGAEPAVPFSSTSLPFEETLMLIRGNNDIDREFLKDKNYIEADPTMIDVDLYMQARIMFTNNYFFNNSTYQGPTSDPNGFIGVRYRCLDTAFNNGLGGYGVNPDVVFQSVASINRANWSSTNAITLEWEFEQMFEHMGAEDGEGLVCFANPQAMRSMNACLKAASTAGGFTISEDGFDRQIKKFMECDIVNCGLVQPIDGGSQKVPNISSAQDINGWQSGDVAFGQYSGFSPTTYYTSLVFVHKDPKKFCCWQKSDPWMEKTMVSGTRKMRIMLDQTLGIFMPVSRGIGMIYGLQVDGPAYD
jgi:hypothetical protein